MSDPTILPRLLTTAFVSSWVGRARAGDRFDADPGRRAGAWAHWAIGAVAELQSGSGRSYPAIVLDGRFHDPGGTGPLLRPHIEIPEHVLERRDAEFPERLAQIGNALAFSWWLPAEATAAKRALWNTQSGELAGFLEVLGERRGGLVDAVITLSRLAAPEWSQIESALVEDPEGLSAEVTRDFSVLEVAEFFPAGALAGVTVSFDAKLRVQAGRAAARRVGVWQVAGTDAAGKRFSFGVMTPRLTSSSQFRDPLFAIERDSAAALLVRGLLLRRLLLERLGAEVGVDGTVGEPRAARSKPAAFLRAVVPQVGEKIPEASEASAVLFLQSYDDAEAAWEALSGWAERSKALLTVNEEGFTAAHRQAMKHLRRAEELPRDDINVLLPLAWDAQSRVVRLTASRRPGDGRG